jgi:hypothetical protein
MSKFLLFFFLSSCAFFIERIDTQLVKDSEKTSPRSGPQEYCPLNRKPSVQLVGTNENAQASYLAIIKANPQFDFLDHFALWNLLQFMVRPDQSSATSRFQLLIRYQEKTHYLDFFSEEKDNQFPFLYGIEWVLNKFGKKRSLEFYAKFLQSTNRIKVGKDFESFLVRNLKAVKENPELAPYYFRGNDVLKENETFPELDYSTVVQLYRKHQKEQKIIVNTTLTQFVTEKGSTGSCNYDFNLYDNSIFLIDKIIPVANLYGISTKGAAFLASSSQKLPKMESLQGLPLFKGESKVRSSAVCKIDNNEGQIWAFSNQSRDPGQHLFHLVRYGLPSTNSMMDVDRLIRHSRHLFLSDPVRLIIESGRSSKDQVENLLKLNLPIYNADKLGNIWAYTMFGEGNRFVIDDRNPGVYRCQ